MKPISILSCNPLSILGPLRKREFTGIIFGTLDSQKRTRLTNMNEEGKLKRPSHYQYQAADSSSFTFQTSQLQKKEKRQKPEQLSSSRQQPLTSSTRWPGRRSVGPDTLSALAASLNCRREIPFVTSKISIIKSLTFFLLGNFNHYKDMKYVVLCFKQYSGEFSQKN